MSEAVNTAGKLITRLSRYVAQDAGADDDNIEREGGSENGGEDAGEDGADAAKQEYVKKEFYARPYVSPYTTESDVKALTTKNTR